MELSRRSEQWKVVGRQHRQRPRRRIMTATHDGVYGKSLAHRDGQEQAHKVSDLALTQSIPPLELVKFVYLSILSAIRIAQNSS